MGSIRIYKGMPPLTEEEIAEQQRTDNILDEDEKEIVRIFRMLPRRDRHEFMNAVYEFEKRVLP